MRAATVSLAGNLAFAFWLGTISAKVSSSDQTINKVYSAVSEDPNSLLVRTSVMEHRLTGVENRLTNVENHLTNVEDKLKSMDVKLNEVLMRLDRLERKIR
jgi:peptidoglycan hydrolase CwlO-like protein